MLGQQLIVGQVIKLLPNARIVNFDIIHIIEPDTLKPTLVYTRGRKMQQYEKLPAGKYIVVYAVAKFLILTKVKEQVVSSL